MDDAEKVTKRAMNSPEVLAMLNDLRVRFLAPNAERIAKLAARKEVAVCVAEPFAQAQEALRDLGWDGTATVFRLSHAARRRLAAACLDDHGDAATHRWLTRQGRRGDVRVLVFLHAGTLLVNGTGEGWEIEPGSTDVGRAQGMH